jgi:intracellular sulfur oxidation DsrE/DsrF family protein
MRKCSILILSACSIVMGSAIFAMEKNASEPISIKVRKDIRAVYEIKDDVWKAGVGKGLVYLEKLLATYQSIGVSETELHLSVVFHGDAGYWMLKDEAFNAFTKLLVGNPNKRVIRKLSRAGVSLELCAQTMEQHGWKAEDILPEVKIVIGAYPRLIDLQLQGYAYIKF